MSSFSSSEDGYGPDEPPELQLDHDKLRSFATNALLVDCISVERLTRGAAHEIFLLRFQKPDSLPACTPGSLVRAEYSCIARFARVNTTSAKYSSEIATIRWIRQHTNLPVPEIYAHDLNPENAVGAAFVLMEKLPGQHLYETWDDLSLEHKKVALSQIAAVVVTFASTSFDKIGCLTTEGIGPIFSPVLDQPKGPFNATLDYLNAYVSPETVSSPDLVDSYKRVRGELATSVTTSKAGVFGAPFPLIHADFDAQNMLFMDSPDGSGPKLTGLIDFEYAHTGPLYFLYEYPVFIQDVDWSPDLYDDNKILRQHFISAIFQRLPTPEARETFIDCINAKTYTLNRFYEAFMFMRCSESTLLASAEGYLEELRDGTGLAYTGRIDYKPEYYTSSGEMIKSEDEEESREERQEEHEEVGQKESKSSARRRVAGYCEKARRRITEGCNFL